MWRKKKQEARHGFFVEKRNSGTSSSSGLYMEAQWMADE